MSKNEIKLLEEKLDKVSEGFEELKKSVIGCQIPVLEEILRKFEYDILGDFSSIWWSLRLDDSSFCLSEISQIESKLLIVVYTHLPDLKKYFTNFPKKAKFLGELDKFIKSILLHDLPEIQDKLQKGLGLGLGLGLKI